ncbi:unnamed protein product [Trichobilharzia szidati]|nr:unnamed protein product [Trichobilharzia szidati]
MSNHHNGHRSTVTECCFKSSIIKQLPDKYVNTLEFRNFTRDMYNNSTFILPPKSVMRVCAKEFLLHSRFNIYSLFSSLAIDHLLITEIGFPQVHGSSKLSPHHV